MQAPAAPPQPDMAPPASSLLLALPDELRLHIAGAVSEWQDRAALCLACPPLGVTAIRTIEAYKDPLLAVAIALWHRSPSSVLDEQCFRRYAADCQASDAGGHWLTATAERHGVGLGFDFRVLGAGTVNECVEWRLTTTTQGELDHALLRRRNKSGLVRHYEGEKGAERRVRAVDTIGAVHYEGERGAERIVWMSSLDGDVQHYEGERGAERAVRVVHANGIVEHLED